MSTITREKIEVLIEKIRKQPTINNIFYFAKVLKKCLSGSDTNQENADVEEEFIIEESEVFDLMLKFGLTEFPVILKKIFLQHQQKKANGNPKILNLNVIKHINNKKMEIILKVFLFNFYKFFSQLHEDDMIIYVLKRLPLISELMYAFPQLVNKTEKQVIEYWATSDLLTVKLHAFVALRKLAMNKEKNEIEQLFRKTYVTFVKNVKQMNWRNYELVIFMINCFNELLNLDFDSAYVIGFSYLRQIALQLKGEMNERKEDSVKKLYNWEILNSLKVWVNILSKNEELNNLIYPLTEIIQGLIQFDKENEYIPTHLHLVRMLIDIQNKSSQFLPILKFIKNILSSSYFSKKLQKSSHTKSFDFVLNLRVTKKHNKSTIFWNDVFKQCLDLAGLALAKFSGHPEAPEVTHHFVKFLTRLGKNLKFIVYKMQIKELLGKINENNQIVYNLRVSKGLAPNQKQAQLSLLSDKETTPLQKLADKIVKEQEALIKQKISAEKEQFFDHKNKRKGEDQEEQEQDQEDLEEDDQEEEEQEEEFDEDQEEQEGDDSYDFQKDLSDVDSQGESIEKEEDYDLEEMEYEGDPDEYNSEDFESGEEDEDQGDQENEE